VALRNTVAASRNSAHAEGRQAPNRERFTVSANRAARRRPRMAQDGVCALSYEYVDSPLNRTITLTNALSCSKSINVMQSIAADNKAEMVRNAKLLQAHGAKDLGF
jgi:hypothetical protein